MIGFIYHHTQTVEKQKKKFLFSSMHSEFGEQRKKGFIVLHTLRIWEHRKEGGIVMHTFKQLTNNERKETLFSFFFFYVHSNS